MFPQNFRLKIFKHSVIIPVSSSLINYGIHPKRQTQTCVRVNQRWGGASNVVLKLINTQNKAYRCQHQTVYCMLQRY
jgi:hypothetical protein